MSTWSVGDLAALSGVTVRTLHHYDEIGLLVPSDRSLAGYRQYDEGDVERLQQIVAYRACGLSLAEIAETLNATGVEREDHLRRQIAMLDTQLDDLARKRRMLTRELEARAMGINLNPQEIFEVFGDFDPTEHAAEAEERWGETDAYRESMRRTSSYTKEDWLRIKAEGEANIVEFAACFDEGVPAEDPRAMAAAEQHRLGIDSAYYPCSYEMHVGLGDMYVADPRFTKTYDDVRPGLASYIRDAIIANALAHTK